MTQAPTQPHQNIFVTLKPLCLKFNCSRRDLVVIRGSALEPSTRHFKLLTLTQTKCFQRLTPCKQALSSTHTRKRCSSFSFVSIYVKLIVEIDKMRV